MNSWFQLPKDDDPAPKARWGHSMCKMNNDLLFMFGGYADSLYFDDAWVFQTKSLKWVEIKQGNSKPQCRSNNSLIFNQKTNKIMMFGGGASRELRFSDIWEFQPSQQFSSNFQGKWKKIPMQNKNSPWCRTYHITEKFHHFMIISGGEAFSSDLDDTWILDLNDYSWYEIKTVIKPSARRFHSSSIIDNYLYIFGGCQGSYKCLKDIYRMDLSLLKQQSINIEEIELNWEKVGYICEGGELNRWGHSICSNGSSTYIFGGRNTDDLNELLSFYFDKIKNTFVLKKIKTLDKPIGRRKGVLMNIGSFLFLHGGFNSQYFSQVHLLNLFYLQQLNHRLEKNPLSIDQELCDIHITTADKYVANLSTPLIENAFSCSATRISFLEMIAEMTEEEVCKYVRILNNGSIEDKDGTDKKLLTSFGIVFDEENSLYAYKKRIVQNVLRKEFQIDSNPFLPLKVSAGDYEKICQLIQSNPHNNVTLDCSDGKKLKVNINLMMFRSKYMRNRFSSKFKKYSKKQYSFQISQKTLSYLLVYFQYGHLLLPENIQVSELLRISQSANMYSMIVLESICQQQIKKILFSKPSRKDLQLIAQKASIQKFNENWKLIYKYAMGQLWSTPHKNEKGPLTEIFSTKNIMQNIKETFKKKGCQYSYAEMAKQDPSRRAEYKEIQEMHRLSEKCKCYS